MNKSRKSLPVIGNASSQSVSSCGSGGGSCGECKTGCSDAGRLGMFALLGVIALLAIPMWLLIDGTQSATATDKDPAFLPELATQPIDDPGAVPVALMLMRGPGWQNICSDWPMPHGPRGPCGNCHVMTNCRGAAPVALATQAPAHSPVLNFGIPVAAAAGDLPTLGGDWRDICTDWPMPHTPRGSCTNCHVMKNCRGAVPKPQHLTAIPTISRTNLLPHQYAGPCKHCHVIMETQIAPVNRENVDQLPISHGERELVLAGQQVVVPSAIQLLQAPVLGHSSVLPHVFVGVCSNCHRVIDLGRDQTPGANRESLARGQNLLLELDLNDRQIARAQLTTENTLRVFFQYLFGFLALGLFFVSMVYIAMKLIVQSKPKARRAEYRKRFGMKRWFQIHVSSSIGMAVAVVLHWAFSEQGNALLHVSLIAVVVLTVSGVFLRYKIPGMKVNKKAMRWLHAQRFLTAVLVVTAIVGHLMIGVD